MVKMKTCFSCNIVRPLRTSHCHVCNRCVLRFDHHCVWFGKCIGEYNYALFLWFLVLTTSLCWYTTILILAFYNPNNLIGYLVTQSVMLCITIPVSISLNHHPLERLFCHISSLLPHQATVQQSDNKCTS